MATVFPEFFRKKLLSFAHPSCDIKGLTLNALLNGVNQDLYKNDKILVLLLLQKSGQTNSCAV